MGTLKAVDVGSQRYELCCPTLARATLPPKKRGAIMKEAFSRRLSKSSATGSNVTLGKHPIHPMMVTFPIAFLMAAVASDAAFLVTADGFWARMSLWLVGAGAGMGLLAGVAGAAELLSIPEIRSRSAAWSHFVAAVMLLSVAFLNWFIRLPDAAAAVYPFGIGLSMLTALLVMVAGWMGGKLVFEYRMGVEE